MSVPGAHSALMMTRLWASYAFPVCVGRAAAAVGTSLVRDLIIQPEAVDCLDDEAAEFHPDALQAIAHLIRIVQVPDGMHDEAVRHATLLLQGLVDRSIVAAQKEVSRSYDMISSCGPCSWRATSRTAASSRRHYMQPCHLLCRTQMSASTCRGFTMNNTRSLLQPRCTGTGSLFSLDSAGGYQIAMQR